MSKKLKAAMVKKVDLAVVTLLSRLTDFQLQSQDREYLDILEDLREHICNFNPEPKDKENGKEETR